MVCHAVGRGFTTDCTDAAQSPTQISTDRGRHRCETSGRFAALAARRRGRATRRTRRATAEPDAHSTPCAVGQTARLCEAAGRVLPDATLADTIRQEAKWGNAIGNANKKSDLIT